jgi:hypothetical protein
MGIMFPEGKKARKLVHSIFRVMHPYYWSYSVAFYGLTYMKTSYEYAKEKVEETVNKCMSLEASDIYSLILFLIHYGIDVMISIYFYFWTKLLMIPKYCKFT